MKKKLTPTAIRFDPEWLEEFDKWRASQLVEPSRAAAIRAGVEMLMRSTSGGAVNAGSDGSRKKRAKLS